MGCLYLTSFKSWKFYWRFVFRMTTYAILILITLEKVQRGGGGKHNLDQYAACISKLKIKRRWIIILYLSTLGKGAGMSLCPYKCTHRDLLLWGHGHEILPLLPSALTRGHDLPSMRWIVVSRLKKSLLFFSQDRTCIHCCQGVSKLKWTTRSQVSFTVVLLPVCVPTRESVEARLSAL